MSFKTTTALYKHLEGVITLEGQGVKVLDESALPAKMDQLVYTAVFADGLVRDTARWIIWQIAQEVGVYLASIHDLYMAIGRGDIPTTFTVPAMNIRAVNYTSSRAVFRAANRHDVGAMLFEIARSEMGYTSQRPSEYVACVLAAALREGYRGPVCIQGDHFQVSAKNFKADPEKEINAVKTLMDEAVAAGFFNIDIDTSTLVDLDFPTLDEQQRDNYARCAELTRYARSLEPAGITISLGGEIGEVGHKNSTVEELDAFMQGYQRVLGDDIPGISKISVQTGTSHGGVVLPDGTLAQVKVDFDTLQELSRVARESYGMGGAVQHGASTLPPNAFSKFSEIGTVEIHLATNFQNMVFDLLPAEQVKEAYEYVHANLKSEWKQGQTEEQFIYSARKKVLGPMKQAWWDLPEEALGGIGSALEEQFAFLFDQLNVKNTRQLAKQIIKHVRLDLPRPQAATELAELEMASDLAD
ncbi:MAG: class II fructose-bisphosphate aldolase [Chloroflexi bacterium]|nr:class II fructose-bisphosphate aldolase [Chloroflexota bacterium]MBP8060035.1 class II fructose-bisphosphate aldolase [Chloroflexota bacterium]